jgi:hypothetical protein
MKAIDKIIIVFGLIAVLIAVGLLLPVLGPSSNCGGNSAALSVCRTYATGLQILTDGEKKEINVPGLPTSNRVELVNSIRAGANWCGNAKFLVRTNAVVNANPSQIVMVCDTPFDNVPQPKLWNGYKKNPAHAVGYSDGSSGLIKPSQFKQLDLSGFIETSLLGINPVKAPVQ